jgi:hypothetical protein
MANAFYLMEVVAPQIKNEGQFISAATLQERIYGSDLRWTG